MNEEKSINLMYAVLCSEGNVERTLNVKKLKEVIPELIIIFSNKENVFQNHLSLFKKCDESDCDGIIILEDDVKLCNNFKKRVESLCALHKDEVVSMFESAMARRELKSEYRAGNKFAWNQCNYYPKSVCKLLADENMLEPFKEWFFTKLNEPWNYPIDRYIAFVLGHYNLKYWMEVPFLVQHLAIKSNFKGRPLNRQSKYFIDDVLRKEGVVND